MSAVSILLAAALAAASGTTDEFGQRLVQLGSPLADERAAAERWLEAHLEPERYADVAAAALAGDAEVRGRLQRVLGSDARHLDLALALCAEKEPDLARLGRESVRAGLARHAPALGELAVRGKNLEELLARTATLSPPRFLRLDGRLSLQEMVEQLELVGELPLGLTIDGQAATRALRREDLVFTGPWNELLLTLSGALGLTVESHGLALESAQPDPEGAFVHIRGEADASSTGIERLAGWLVELATSADEPARVRAALNLGSSGFAPALVWMDRRARAGDRAALEGLLRAGARGRAAPALSDGLLLEALLAEAAGGPGGPGGSGGSARILAGLASGPCVDSRGAPLAPRLLAGFDGATPRARWARLHVLEGRGCGGSELGSAVGTLLAAPETPPALRLEALMLAVAQPGASAPPRIAGLPELFRLPLDATELERLGRGLLALGVEPPHADPATIPATWGLRERLTLVQAFLWSGARAPLGAHVGALLDGPPERVRLHADALAAELQPWLLRGSAPLLRAALASAGERTPARASALRRVRLILGLVPAAEIPAALEAIGWTPERAGGDLALLGGLAALSGPPEVARMARERLLAELVTALRTRQTFADGLPVVQALELAAQGLFAAGHDDLGESLARDVRRTFRAEPRSELTRKLERSQWPPAPGTETRDLARELARHEVPASL
jgi:hypothetical protein